jgi:hypothetical protein
MTAAAVLRRVARIARRRATMTQVDRRRAKAYAQAWEIYCPHCDGDDCASDPIPDSNGSHLWDELPQFVTCPTCKRTFAVEVH